MSVHYPKLHNMVHTLNVFTASKGSNFLFSDMKPGNLFVAVFDPGTWRDM